MSAWDWKPHAETPPTGYRGKRIEKNYHCHNCRTPLEFGKAKLRVHNGSTEYYCLACYEKLLPRKCSHVL